MAPGHRFGQWHVRCVIKGGVRRRIPADPPDVLRQTVFGDASLDVWTARGAGQPGEPGDSFERARELAQAGQPAPPDQARVVLGVVAEMPVRKGHDLLAAYRDGTARYLNYSGKAVIWDDHSDSRVQAAITSWLNAGQVIASNGFGRRPAPCPASGCYRRLKVRWVTPLGLFTASIWNRSSSPSSPSQSRSPRPSTIGTTTMCA